jgi:hypothetical protein
MGLCCVSLNKSLGRLLPAAEEMLRFPGMQIPPPASLDGTGNNPIRPLWGSAGSDLLRFSAAAYGDGVASPSGTKRPSAREVSNGTCVQTTTIRNNRNMSSYVYGWGQFIDHDLDLTTSGGTDFNIIVPTGDPDFDPNNTGTKVINFTRSNFDAKTGTASPSTVQTSLRIILNPTAQSTKSHPLLPRPNPSGRTVPLGITGK